METPQRDPRAAADVRPSKFRGNGHLEGRNKALKQQLSQSLVQQAQLTSVLEKLKASLRLLWRAGLQAADSSVQKASPSGAPSTTPPSRENTTHLTNSILFSYLSLPEKRGGVAGKYEQGTTE